MTSAWSMKSKAISNVRLPCGIGDVVNPRAVTYIVTCQEWLVHGVCARRTLPTICDHMCSVAAVSAHASSGSTGQVSSRVRAVGMRLFPVAEQPANGDKL